MRSVGLAAGLVAGLVAGLGKVGGGTSAERSVAGLRRWVFAEGWGSVVFGGECSVPEGCGGAVGGAAVPHL